MYFVHASCPYQVSITLILSLARFRIADVPPHSLLIDLHLILTFAVEARLLVFHFVRSSEDPSGRSSPCSPRLESSKIDTELGSDLYELDRVVGLNEQNRVRTESAE